MKVHFIAIGGSAMHNLALALNQKGYHISGSDDEIYEPSYSRLQKAGILPEKMGWFASQITDDIDVVILGMHARIDNPELIKAQNIGIKIYSYPEYIAILSQQQKRVVVAGSHGKTTTTSMIMHALKYRKIEFDYLVGAQLPDFDLMVKISQAPIMVIEGDEYLSSPIDRRPKIHHYRPHVAIITGIAWDHINVFPTFENYKNQFAVFLTQLEIDGIVVYNAIDSHVVDIIEKCPRQDLKFIPYTQVELNESKKIISSSGQVFVSPLIGMHNYQNMAAALEVAKLLGVPEKPFFESMADFTGASKRLQLVTNKISDSFLVYLDFAHAPSKVAGTTKAIKSWFPERKLIVVLELHTYSSLNKNFLPLYKDSLEMADQAVVYYNDHVFSMKKMPSVPASFIQESFKKDGLKIINRKERLHKYILSIKRKNAVIIFMTSGNYNGLSIADLFE